MLDSLRHVRSDIRTGMRWLTALATVNRLRGVSEILYLCVLCFVETVMFLRFSSKSGPETTRPVAVTRDGSCVFNSVLAVDPVGQGQRR